MGVVECEQREVDQDDVILIQEEEGKEELKKKTLSTTFTKLPLILFGAGTLIFITTVIIWTTAYIEHDCPLFLVLVSLLMIFHGLIGLCKTSENYNLDVMINEKQFSCILPLRHVLGASVNTVIGIAGVTSIPILHWHWRQCSTWEILGLILSSLLLLYVIISFWMIYLKKIGDMQFQNSKSPEGEALQKSLKVLQKSVNYLETSCGEYLGNVVQLFNSVLPMPDISSVTNANVGQVLKQQRRITHKPVHILLLLLAMIVCVLMFSSQLWFVSTSCNTFNDCEVDDYFARKWAPFAMMWRVEDRILIILISTPVTFLLSTILIILMKKTNVLRMLLFIIISLVLGSFFLVFSYSSVQFIILMGKLPFLPKILTLASLLPVPVLAVVFLALAYTNILHLKEENNKKNLSNSKNYLVPVCIFLLFAICFISLTTMTVSNLTITSTMQKNWNSTQDHSYDKECREREEYHNKYGYYRTTTTTTVAPTEKPVKCYGKTLDYRVQERMAFFSISQMTVSESLLFFSLIVILSGRRLTKKSLFIPGLLLFASAISTCIAIFNGLDPNLDDYEISSLFFIMNCLAIFGAFVIGFFCFVTGSSALISFLELVLRLILSSIIFIFIILFSIVQCFLKLASRLGSMKMTPTKPNEEPEVI